MPCPIGKLRMIPVSFMKNTGIIQQRSKLFENELQVLENNSFSLYEFQVESHLLTLYAMLLSNYKWGDTIDLLPQLWNYKLVCLVPWENVF